jgi:predicted permease
VSRYRRTPRPGLGGRRELKDELDEEIRTHLELRTEGLIAQGWAPEDARREAERRFGHLERARADLHASARRRESTLGWHQLADELRRDARHALRQAAREPGYAATAVGIFGLGIALTTTMFTVVDHVLLRPLPFPDPDRLVSLQSVPESGEPFDQVSMENWVDWQTGATTLAATGVYRTGRYSVRVGDEAERIAGASVSGAFFETLRPSLAAGRAFGSEEGQAREPLALVSSDFARSRFGDAAAAVGRDLEVNGRGLSIVGVVPARQAFPEGTAVWTAEPYRPGSGGMRNNINYSAIARVDAEATLETVRAELGSIARGIRESDPEGIYSWGVGVLPLHDVVVGEARTYLRLLMGAVVGVLLIACANLAGLGIARSRRRRSELAVRLALGSGRGRLVRQLLTEHALLGLAGGALGLAAAWWIMGAVSARISALVPRATEVAVDARVAAFAFAAALLAGVGAGLLPALRASGVTPGRGLGSARGRISGGRGLPGAVLVGAEVALAFAILVGGALLLRSFQSVVARDLGFEPEGIVTAEVTLTGGDYTDFPTGVAYWDEALSSLSATPGVASVAVGNWIPTGGAGTSFLELPDDPSPEYGGGYRVVSDAYFETLGIPLLAGRTFGPGDAMGTERVTLVNAALAERAWPGRIPLGERIRATSMESWMHGGQAPWLTVIGVVGDVRHHGFEADARPELFVLYRQVPPWTTSMTLVARPLPGLDEPIAPRVREVVRAVDPALAVDLGDLEGRVAALLAERRLTLDVLVGFALAALFLTCLGLYGLVAYAVEERTREMAIRAALGARRSGLLGLMLGSAARVIAWGAVAGAVTARWLTGFVDSLLVGVTGSDPVSYVAAVAILAAVGLLAALVPSLKAARQDPAEALATVG